MNKKLWLIDGLLFIVFLLSYIWTSFSRLIFYIKYGSLYLALAIFIYLVVTISYNALLKRTNHDKQVVILGIIHTVSMGVFLLVISVLEINYVKKNDIYKETYCQYYDINDNLIYNSQYGNGCAEIEVLDFSAKTGLYVFRESVTEYFEEYHSNVTARDYSDLELTFEMETIVEVVYMVNRVVAAKVISTENIYSVEDNELFFHTRRTMESNITYEYNPESVVVTSHNGDIDTGSEIDPEYDMYHMDIPEDNFFTAVTRSERWNIGGQVRIKVYNEINDEAKMLISSTVVTEEEEGYQLVTTHHEDDDRVTKTEYYDDRVIESLGKYAGTTSMSQNVYNYTNHIYAFNDRYSLVKRNIDYEPHGLSWSGLDTPDNLGTFNTIGDPNIQNLIHYSNSNRDIVHRIKSTEYGYVVIRYERNPVSDKTTLGYGSVPGPNWLFKHHYRMFNAEVSEYMIYQYNPLYIYYYDDEYLSE